MVPQGVCSLLSKTVRGVRDPGEDCLSENFWVDFHGDFMFISTGFLSFDADPVQVVADFVLISAYSFQEVRALK